MYGTNLQSKLLVALTSERTEPGFKCRLNFTRSNRRSYLRLHPHLTRGGQILSEAIDAFCSVGNTFFFNTSVKSTGLVQEWKTNLMSLAILFHFLCAQHVSDINISIIRSLRMCCWITTSIVLFCKDGWFSISVNLRCRVVCIWCDVFCRFVVVGRRILIDIDRYLLCFVIIMFVSCGIFHWLFGN